MEDKIGRKPEAPAETVGAAEPVRMTGMRAAIAAAMARSKRDIPHYYLAHTIDLTKVSHFVTKVNATRSPADRLLAGALYVKAVARAVGKFPEFNGHFTDGCFRQSEMVHIGTAINIRGGGLVAPAIHNAQSLDLDAMISAMRDLVSRARAGRFRSSEISDSTITISSLGDRGVDTLYGIIYPPQVAIVGFGTPSERPWGHDGKLEVRRLVIVTLAADHRVSDGHRGAFPKCNRQFSARAGDIMKTTEIEVILREAVHRIAPDIDVTAIDREADLREEFDIDSMDFLNLVTALSNRLHIEMPEADYPQMMTYNAMITYLFRHRRNAGK